MTPLRALCLPFFSEVFAIAGRVTPTPAELAAHSQSQNTSHTSGVRSHTRRVTEIARVRGLDSSGHSFFSVIAKRRSNPERCNDRSFHFSAPVSRSALCDVHARQGRPRPRSCQSFKERRLRHARAPSDCRRYSRKTGDSRVLCDGPSRHDDVGSNSARSDISWAPGLELRATYSCAALAPRHGGLHLHADDFLGRDHRHRASKEPAPEC